jgi:hypothetical protein
MPLPPAATCGGESFTASTKVLLAVGIAVPIASLKPGDMVLAISTKTGKTSAEPVTAVLLHHDLYDPVQRAASGLGSPFDWEMQQLYPGALPNDVSVVADDVSMTLRGAVMQQLRMFGAAMGIALITGDGVLRWERHAGSIAYLPKRAVRWEHNR